MKLDEYVRQTLPDITKGVAEAIDKSRVWIAPGYVDGEKVFSAQLVPVTREGSGAIQVLSLGKLRAKGSSEHTNKIAFPVPVSFHAPR